MSGFINEQNEFFNANNIFNRQLDLIFQKAEFTNTDVIENIFAKYYKDSDKFSLDSQEIAELEKASGENIDLTIKLSLLAFLACYDKKYEERFLEYFNNFLDLCFKQTDENDILIFFNNLNFIIVMIIELSRNKNIKIKDRISKDFSKKIKEKKVINEDILFTIYDLMMCDDFKFFDKTTFVELNNLKIDIKIDSTNFCKYVKYIQFYIYFLYENEMNSKCKEVKVEYCNFVLEHLDDFKINLNVLYEIREYMLTKTSKTKFNQVDFYKIENKIKFVREEFLKNLLIIKETPNDNINEAIKILKERELEKYSKLMINSGFSRLNENIEKCINNFSLKVSPNESLDEFNYNFILKENKIIFLNKLKSEDLNCYQFKEYFKTECEIYYFVYFQTFFKINNDKKLIRKELKNVFKDNKLINKSRKKYLVNKFTSFFKEDYINSTYDIILEFEEILRMFFKYKGLSIDKNERDLIGINDIFNIKDDNYKEYREILIKEIGKLFFDSLKYLLYEKYGCDIRNRISHRYESSNLYESYEVIYLVMLIFNFICKKGVKLNEESF